jgi:class 3 adenylate cyclase
MSDDASHLRHELRTPVNHIAGYAELILEDDDGVPGPLAAALQRIAATARESLSAIAGIVDADAEGLPGRLAELETHVAGMEGQLRLARAEARTSDSADLDRITLAIGRLRELVSGAVSARVATSADAMMPAAPPVGGMQPTVLVVDDDASNRDLLSRRVERLGYRTIQAENGREALVAMMAGGIDLVLLDIMMPVMDGYGVLERRREDAALRDIPVIMISALDQLESVVRCIEAGAEDYLPKPFDPVLLKARAKACIEQKRLRDEQKRLHATISGQADELRRWNEELEARVAEKAREVARLSLMERFVAPQLARAISEGGETILQSHRREIAALFCDLRGFTSFAETAEPEDVMGVLSELHDAVGPLIFEHEGTLAQFTGDGLMVFFNDPIPCTDPAWRAVQLGLGMQARTSALATGWRRRGHELALGVGLAMGHATCGQIGFQGRFEYTAIGTVINMAARLCGEARGGQVLASQRVMTLVQDRVVANPVGDLTLKGFSRPVPGYDILSRK